MFSRFVAACCAGVLLSFSITAPSAMAELVYVDAVDFNNHPDAPGGNNTFLADTLPPDPMVTVTGNGTSEWRYRTTGPGAPAYGGNSFSGRGSEGDPEIYTVVTGLTPGQAYGGLRLYFIVSPNNTIWYISYSLDGVTWSAPINRVSSGVVTLNFDPNDPLGTAGPTTSADTRCYIPINGTLTADVSGEIRFYVRPEGTDRSVYDGFTYDDGVIPPPTAAHSPQPPNGANFFATSSVTNLSWSNPPPTGTITCDVYFGDQNDYDAGNTNHFGLPLEQSGVSAESISVPPLTVGEKYYWIVDCDDTIAGSVEGDLWSFEILDPSSATGLLISEFMAANDSTLTNSLGGIDDWIEIYNNSASSVDLAGWYLTDSTNELTKYQIPATASTLLEPQGRILVWMSNEDTVANGEIHASFRLSAGGEYLALVRPDGVTVEHDYFPVFPDQDGDISYGVDLLVAGSDLVLLPSQSGCRYLVPTSDPGTGWRDLVFDDSSWSNGVTAVGYETSSSFYQDELNTDLQAAMYNQTPSAFLRLPFVVDDPAAFSSLTLSMGFEDGFVAYINGVEVAQSNAPPAPSWNSTASASRAVGDALLLAPFTIAQSPDTLLVPGTNVLSIQAMNVASSITNFYVQPELEGALTNGYTVQLKRYYSVPTPGAANSDAFEGFVDDTKFSVDRGFFTNSFSVAITCDTPGAAIRYTLDGSTPSDVHGTLYSGPVNITTTTTLRAIAYRTGWMASDVDTQTYLFPEDVLVQPTNPGGSWPSVWVGHVTSDAGGVTWSDYEMDPTVVNDPQYSNEVRTGLHAIPTISIVTDLDKLFDPDDGIYVNPREKGPAWERTASAELIYPDGSEGFQINCGIQMQGGGSRGPNSTPHHSMRLLFKGVYGPTKLNHALFAGSDVESFDTLHLRAAYNNAWPKVQGDQRERAQYNRDLFARDLQREMGHVTTHGNLCHLYINGLYWGVYSPGERPDASWASEHFGGSKEEWDALNHGSVRDGNSTAWNQMNSYANSGLSSTGAYASFRQYCDVVNLADYVILNHYIGSYDWGSRNWWAARRQQTGARYKFICWDSEGSLVNVSHNTVNVNEANRPSGLFHRAVANAEFKLLVADRIHRHFFNDGVLTPARLMAIWETRASLLEDVLALQSARWGDVRGPLYTPNNQYATEKNRLMTSYFPVRSGIVLNQYISAGLYPSVAAPGFVGSHGGTFTNSTTVGIQNLHGSGSVYYTLDGSDPREYGTGNIVGTLYSGNITLTNSTRVKARCYSSGTWSALLEADFLDVSPSPLRISEVMYVPRLPEGAEGTVSEDRQAFAFVEIHNTDASNTVGLVGVSLADGLKFDFGDGPNLSLPPGGYMVVVENPAAFGARYPSVTADKIAGEYRGDLTFSGDAIDLMVEGVGAVVSMEYSDGRGWPLSADGFGHSLIPLILTNQSNGVLDYCGNWTASVDVDGSPGAAEPAPFSTVLLNEVIAHTDFSDTNYPGYDSNDKIELINDGVSTVSLDGYYLTDNEALPKKWAIPTGINVPAGGIIVFDEITGFHSPLTNGFGLDKAGEQVLLSYALGGGPASVVDAVTFKGQANGRSLGRYPDATGDWRKCLPTPSANNVLAGQQPVISEIMYHPTSNIPFIDNTEDEFVEIHNPTGQDVNLWTTETGTNIGSWRLDGEVDYVFPASTVLSATSHALIVSFDPANETNRAAFLTRYGLSEPITLFGPFSGKLSNEGGRLALERPQGADLVGGAISWVIVDEVIYAEDTPWMPSADGWGDSLQRTVVSGSGLNPTSWTASTPNPESGSAIPSDLDLFISHTAGELKLHFNPQPGYSYAVEMNTNGLGSTQWVDYFTVTNPATEFIIDLPNDVSPAFFRLRRDP